MTMIPATERMNGLVMLKRPSPVSTGWGPWKLARYPNRCCMDHMCTYLEADEESLQHLPLLRLLVSLQGCSTETFETFHRLPLDVACNKGDIEEGDRGGGQDHHEQPEGHGGQGGQVADKVVDGEDHDAHQAGDVGGDDQAEGRVHILHKENKFEVLISKL